MVRLGGRPRSDPFIQANGGDEAAVVYHEYTHGLSNRLVIDATGNSTLGGGQAGSMGEAWSDWYALDFLVGQGQFTDTPADGERLTSVKSVKTDPGSHGEACTGSRRFPLDRPARGQAPVWPAIAIWTSFSSSRLAAISR